MIYYDCEYKIEEYDLETVQNLIEEIGTRFEAFENRIKGRRTELAKKLFEKPIKKLLDKRIV